LRTALQEKEALVDTQAADIQRQSERLSTLEQYATVHDQQSRRYEELRLISEQMNTANRQQREREQRMNEKENEQNQRQREIELRTDGVCDSGQRTA